MAADAEMTPAEGHTQDSKAPASQGNTGEAVSVQADIQHNLTLIRSAVSILEPRLTTKVLRTLGSIRKRLTATALKDVIESAFPASKSNRANPFITLRARRLIDIVAYLTDDEHRTLLLGYIGDAAKQEMDVDSKPVAAVKSILSATGLISSRGATPSGARPGTPMRSQQDDFLPEEDIYLTLLTIIYLLDSKEFSKVCL